MPKLIDWNLMTPSSESEALEGAVLDVVPNAQVRRHGSRELPFESFVCDVDKSPRVSRTEISRIDGRLAERLAPRHAKLLGAEIDNDEVTRLVAVCGDSPNIVRRITAAYDRRLEHDFRAIGTSLDLLRIREDSTYSLTWSPRGTTMLRVLQDRVRRFLLHHGFTEIHPESESCYVRDQRLSARDLPLRLFTFSELDLPYDAPGTGDPDRFHFKHWSYISEFVYLRDDQLADELESWRDRVADFFPRLGLTWTPADLPSVAGANDVDLGSYVHGSWGTPEYDASRIRGSHPYTEAHTKRGEKIAVAQLESSPFPSFEQLLAVLLETYADELPLWLAPEQVRIVPIKRAAAAHAERVLETLHSRDIRAAVDRREERWENKVRQPVNDRIPYFLVLGDREVEGDSVDVRTYREPRTSEIVPLGEFVDRMATAASPTL